MISLVYTILGWVLQICLDRTFGPAELAVQPSLPSGVVIDEQSKKEITEEGGEKSLKDSELLELDVVRALVRMNIIPRIRCVYFLRYYSISRTFEEFCSIYIQVYPVLK